MSVKEDLLKAAEIMKERGRCEGIPVDHAGRCCPLGAIGLATIPEFYGQITTRELSELFDINQRASKATLALAHAIKPGADTVSRASIDIWQFNDFDAGSDQEVINMMIEAANSAGDE